MTQRWFFHAAPPSMRRTIASSGLKPGHTASYGPPAVYLFRHRLIAENYRTERAMDVWRVDGRGLALEPDPEDEREAVFSLEAIPARRVSFVGTYFDGEEVP